LDECGRILLNILKKTPNHELPGTRLFKLKDIANKNKHPNNPNQFDYATHLEQK
jgi:hypothetical protein